MICVHTNRIHPIDIHQTQIHICMYCTPIRHTNTCTHPPDSNTHFPYTKHTCAHIYLTQTSVYFESGIDMFMCICVLQVSTYNMCLSQVEKCTCRRVYKLVVCLSQVDVCMCVCLVERHTCTCTHLNTHAYARMQLQGSNPPNSNIHLHTCIHSQMYIHLMQHHL